MKSLSKKAISLILAVLMIMDVFTPVAVVASTNSPQNNVHVLDEVPESETNSQNNDILIPAKPQTNPEEDTLVPAEVPAQNSSQNSSQKPAQKPAQKPVQNNKTPNQLYKSWTLVNPGKTTYAKGDILDLSQLSVRVTKEDGTVTTLSYVQLLKDTNFDIIENVGNKINLQPGKGSVTLVGPSLNPITVNIVVNDSADKLQGTNSKDELVPAIDPQAKEENDELVVAENPNDKKTNIIEGNEQNSPEKDKLLENEKDALEGTVLAQVAGKETEGNPSGLPAFDPLKALGLNKEDRELTEEELEAGLTKVELPTLNEAPVSPVFARSTYQSTGLLGTTSFDDQLDMSDEFEPQAVGAGNNSDLHLDGKKFHVITRFDTSVAAGSIQSYQYFKIHLDEKLKVNNTNELKDITHDGKVIATPTYDPNTNIITYNLTQNITKNIQVPIDIPVDYNPANIKLDDDGTFTVTNKVSGLGVEDPKDLIPAKVNKFGIVTNQIIEPNRKDVNQIIEQDNKNYRVDLDGWATPVIKDKKLEGYNWTFKVKSNSDLETLGYKANFTTVKGSGLGEIKEVKINGQSVELTDQLQGGLGIVDSKHHDLTNKGVTDLTYTFYTEATNKQGAYMVDLSVILTKQDNKVGAKRFIVNEAYNYEKIGEATPNRVGINNRTTILGELTSENTATWTVTDAISTGDDKDQNGNKKNTPLPLGDRILGGNQSLQNGQIAVYKLDGNGKMVQDGTTQTNVNPMPGKGQNPSTDQSVGTIAVYEYNTNINQEADKSPLTLSGVSISKYENININQEWSLGPGTNMPEQTIKAVDEKGTEIGSVKVPADTDQTHNQRRITIPDAKVWTINNDGNGNITATKSNTKVVQEGFPLTVGDIKYYENSNYYKRDDVREFFIHNRATKDLQEKSANFTVSKIDSQDDKKKLQGATFKLLGATGSPGTSTSGPEATTDANGNAEFTNIVPGNYTLVETKAPGGYKLGEDIDLVVTNQGRVSINNTPNATLTGGTAPTEYSEDSSYPGYMNASYYGTIDESGKAEAYIYLKPNSGDTNRNTRLNLVPSGGTISKVEVYDVDPTKKRSEIKKAMEDQNVDTKISGLGNNRLNVEDWKTIRGTANVTDPFTKKTGYQITMPKDRMANDWGFLIKVTGNKTPGSVSAGISFDWLTDGDVTFTRNNSKIQTSINLQGKGDTQSVITIKNEAFTKKSVKIEKIDQNGNGLNGARFTIREKDSKEITATEYSKYGEVNFGEMPEGQYIIEETSAPDGYQKSNVIFDVTVDSSKQVSYKPRFKEGNGKPTYGVDYIIENQEDTQNPSDTIVTKVLRNELRIWKNEPGDIGIRPNVWEAYRYESLKYNAEVELNKPTPGTRFTIQFDHNLDFTQYVNEMPKISEKGQVIADPYFDYNTNTLTYVFNSKSTGSLTKVNLEIKGVIPSKFYAKNNGTYYFTNTIEPGKIVQTLNGAEQTATKGITANYESYDTSFSSPAQSYYFRDVYKKGNDWYVTVIAYYNPLMDTHKGARELKFNWASTKRRNDLNMARWPIEGEKPAFDLQEVNIYRVLPRYDNGTITNEVNMPLSFGIRPEQDPGIYNLVYSRDISSGARIRDDKQNSITLNYDPDQIKNYATLDAWSPLRIRMPAISKQNEGYVIEQNFKVTNMGRWLRLWRTFYMNNGVMESAFTTKVNENTAVADQIGKEIPKFYSQKVKLINKKYIPGKFTINKLNEADRSSKLDGAVFTLTGEDNIKITRTTIDGKITFDGLKPGKYTLEETTPPTGYNKTDSSWQISVDSLGTVTITETGLNASGDSIVGNNIEIDITNKPTETDFNVYKKDDKGNPLKGAKFKLTKQGESQAFATGESDGNGKVSFNTKLVKGIYIIEETEPPLGYQKLDKKWVVEIDADNKAKVYNYVAESTGTTDPNVDKSILGEAGTHWVDVAHRSLAGWDIYDNRWGGYVDNRRDPHKMGTRIIGINKDKKYVIQRYVINPEAVDMDITKAVIHREKPEYTNMDWFNLNNFAKNKDIKVFTLDNPVRGNVEDIRLQNFTATDITDKVDIKSVVGSGSQNRLNLTFNDVPKAEMKNKPIIVDIKVPYKDINGGVGTGMDLYADKTIYWKSDYYEQASIIPEGDSVKQTDTTKGNIKGSYISDDSLDVTNEQSKTDFKFKKVKEKKNDSDTADAISGATFKLVGPRPSKADKWEKSDKDGYVKFKDLTPGVYILEETGAAQGYEPAKTTWTVTITRDGKVYFRDNNPDAANPEPSGPQWQKVNDLNAQNAGRDRRLGSYDTNPYNAGKAVKTYITEVDKTNNKFKQVFIINKQREYLANPELQIHSYPEDKNLSAANTKIISIKEVSSDAEPDNIGTLGNDVPYTTKVVTKRTNDGRDIDRLVINTTVDQSKTLMLEVESSLPLSGGFGLGVDFKNRGTYWGAEKYNSINDVKLEPLPNSNGSTGKSRSYYLADATADQNGASTNIVALYMSKTMSFRSANQSLADMVQGTGLGLGEELVGQPVGQGNDLGEISNTIESSNANITVSAGQVDTTTGKRTINVSVTPKEGGNTGLIGKNLQYVFLIDRSQDSSTNHAAADAPNIDRNINKFLTDLAEKAKANNTKIDVTFIEYSRTIANNYNVSNKNKSKVLGGYNQDLQSLYDSASSFTYNMKTRSFNDRNNVTAKDILGKVGISNREKITKAKDDGSRGLLQNIGSHYNNIVSNGKKYDKRIVLNIANFEASSADFYYETPGNTRSQKKYYIADNNWDFRKPENPEDKRFDSYVLHIEQKSRQETEYEKYMRTNSGTWHIDKNENPQQGIYSYKGFLESNLMKDDYLKGTQAADAYLVKDGRIDIKFNSVINLATTPSPYTTSGTLNIPKDRTTLSITGINLRKNETLNLKYDINLKDTANNNEYYQIHDKMTYKPDPNANTVDIDPYGMVTRRNAYTVTFNNNGKGGTPAAQTIIEGKQASEPTLTEEGYTFDGWYTDENLQKKYDFNTPVKRNLTLYAKWTSTSTPTEEFTVNFVINGHGIQPQEQKVQKGNRATEPTLSEIGYKFEGWYTDSTLQNKYNFDSEVNSNLTLYAKWTPEAPPSGGHSIIFENISNGKVTAEKTTGLSNGENVTLKVEPNSGYILDALYVDGAKVEVTNNTYTFTMQDSDVKVSATFKLKEETKPGTFTVSVGTTGNGTVTASPNKDLTEGAEVTLTVRAEDGYELEQLLVGSEDMTAKLLASETCTFKMPAGNVEVKASFKKFEDPLIKFKPDKEDKLISDKNDPNNPAVNKIPEIINKQVGLELKVFKRNKDGLGLKGGKFKLTKTDEKYQKKDLSFTVEAESDDNGNVIFKDQQGKPVKLKEGNYIIEEINPPEGYKKAPDVWKIAVKKDGGRIHADYYEPEKTPGEFVESNDSYIPDPTIGTNASIKYKSKITHIDPDAKTFVQRIYIDMRGYSGSDKVNLQITPKYKRDETDFVPDKEHGVRPPQTNIEGLKTAYRTTYKLSEPDKANVDDVLKYYDLSKPGVTMVNTARWRPFGWGFDEDILNLEKGQVYFIDIEGYYDDALITGIDNHQKDTQGNPLKRTDIDENDLKKLQMDFKFYDGAREFQQAVYENGKIVWKVVDKPKGNYQAGNAELNKAGKNVDALGKAGGKIYPALGDPKVTIETSADISSLYTDTKNGNPKEIPKEGLTLLNEREVYNITFSKHGRDGTGTDWNDNSANVTNNRLEGAIFKLQKRLGNSEVYEDVPGSFVSSAFNGFFGFRGLEPGRYRLMEVKAPKGYKPIKDAILYMTIAYTDKDITVQDPNTQKDKIIPKGGYITLEYDKTNGIVRYSGGNATGTGQLTDFVTAATAKNMGKIINEKPGKGKVSITKLDENKNLLDGAEFQLLRLSNDDKSDENATPSTYTGTVKDGKLVFDELPIGNYVLKETKAAPGHVNKGQRWYFTIGGNGLDLYAGDTTPATRDISDKITIDRTNTNEDNPRIEVLKTISGDDSDVRTVIYPHRAQSISITSKFKIDKDTKIKPGDYFDIKLSDFIDLYGIESDKPLNNLDIFADGVGTVARAEYNKDTGIVRYIFTQYAKTYTLEELKSTIIAWVNLQKVKDSTTNVPIGISLNSKDYNKKYYVNYDLLRETSDRYAGYGTVWWGYNRKGQWDRISYYNHNITGKIVKLNKDTGEFKQYYYINRLQDDGWDNWTFRYDPYRDSKIKGTVSDVRVTVKKLNNYRYKKRAMPESFAVDMKDSALTTTYEETYPGNISEFSIPFYDSANRTYVVEITGKFPVAAIDTLETAGEIWVPASGGGVVAARYDVARYNVNETKATAEMKVEAINPTNKVIFRKVNGSGQTLKGAKFYLAKWDETITADDKWIKIKNSDKTTAEDGLIVYEKLEPGRYALFEEEAPEGYKRLDGVVEEFVVKESGEILREIQKSQAIQASKQSTEEATSSTLKNMVESVKTALKEVAGQENKPVTQTLDSTPVDIVNSQEIEFVKVDGNNKEKKLENAIFEVYYKSKETEDYKPYTVKKTENGKTTESTMKVKSGADGKFSLQLSKPGYYALQEIQAPKEYTKIPGWIKEFSLINGKFQVKQIAPLKNSFTKGDKGMLTSEIIEVDKDKGIFKQRIIINPNHTEWRFDGPGTHLRFLEKGWNIDPIGMIGSVKGGKIRAAVLPNGTNVSQLKDTDYKELVPSKSYNYNSGGKLSRYPIRDMFKNIPYEDNRRQNIKTSDSIVVEYTGKLDDKTKPIDIGFDIYFDLQEIDEINYKLDLNNLSSKDPIYVDKDDDKPIEVENRKAEYPHTGGMGTFIFTCIGASLVGLAYLSYRRRRGLVFDE
ncbi:SpaA isopeptide-forming pilin-related protein [Peptoniphilus duerdenii]|uniref:SpaA isopeptide-forming pilin-related protein n=1 Tax=Peptoniphilus duerdenii TaxID=507750 RepID=UPI0028890D2C|nr:SpaA isopeptide-forming pilin-related protein [Peptoniphilus duerdenii]